MMKKGCFDVMVMVMLVARMVVSVLMVWDEILWLELMSVLLMLMVMRWGGGLLIAVTALLLGWWVGEVGVFGVGVFCLGCALVP